MNYALWFSGTVLLLVAVAYGLLTHFGLVPGALDIAPWLYAGAFTVYVVAIGVRWPVGALGAGAAFAILFIAVEAFNWLGLRGYI